MSSQRTPPILAAATGSESVAAELAEAGANALFAYHSSTYRSRGISSVAGLLPWANANMQTLDLLDGVLAGAGRCPVLATVCANDQLHAVGEMLDQLCARGAGGVLNAPTVGLFTGPVRNALEASGLGSHTEIELIGHAHSRGLQAWCYVFDEDWTRRAVDAGADVLVIHLGFTGDGDPDAQLRTAEACLKTIDGFGANASVVLHGGTLRKPQDMTSLLDTLGGPTAFGHVGFFGASAFERSSLGVAPGQAMQAWRTTLQSWGGGTRREGTES